MRGKEIYFYTITPGTIQVSVSRLKRSQRRFITPICITRGPGAKTNDWHRNLAFGRFHREGFRKGHISPELQRSAVMFFLCLDWLSCDQQEVLRQTSAVLKNRSSRFYISFALSFPILQNAVETETIPPSSDIT